MPKRKLPDYEAADYWEKRYKTKKSERAKSGMTDEWYYGYSDVAELLPRRMSSALDLGCGNSTFLLDLHAARPAVKCVGVDLAASAIAAQEVAAPELDFRVADARKLPFDDEAFDFVVDKATLDAVLTGNNGLPPAKAICREMGRVLRPGGCLLWMTMFGPHVGGGVEVLRKVLLPGLSRGGAAIDIEVHRIGEPDDDEIISVVPELAAAAGFKGIAKAGSKAKKQPSSASKGKGKATPKSQTNRKMEANLPPPNTTPYVFLLWKRRLPAGRSWSAEAEIDRLELQIH
jgi:SAM-dependent methyltransferase